MQLSTTPTGTTPAEVKRCVKRLRSRFERWELPHLRDLAAGLHEQLEEANARAESAEASLEFWHRHAMDLQDELLVEKPGTAIGLSQDGALHVLNGSAA